MKVISSINGRATQVFSPDDVRSERPPYLPEVVERFQEKYGFISHSDLKEAGSQGIKFERGRLLRAVDSISIEHLDIYNDGIVAICSNTGDADLVLDDAIEWGIQTIRMRRPNVMMPRTYTSWLVVEFEEPVSALIANFMKLQGLIQGSYEQAYGKKLAFNVLKISFNSDPKLLPPYTNTEYSIDRRGGVPYSDNRFFCAAPLRTEEHVTLMKNLEVAFKK